MKAIPSETQMKLPVIGILAIFAAVVVMTWETTSLADETAQDRKPQIATETKQDPPVAVVLLMHPAEMRRGNSIQRFAAASALGALEDRDYCGVLRYGKSGTTWLWPKGLTKIGSRRDELLTEILKSVTGDFPDFGPAFKIALEALSEIEDANRRMIILTDGDPYPPTDEVLKKFKAAGITVSVVHPDIHKLGNQGMARRIAVQTGGRYYHIRNGNSKIIGTLFQREVGASRDERQIERN